MAIKEHDNRRQRDLVVTHDYVGHKHTRIVTIPKGEVAAAVAEGGVLGPGSVMPAQFGGPGSLDIPGVASVLSPMLQYWTRGQQPAGSMEELTLVYIEILPPPE